MHLDTTVKQNAGHTWYRKNIKMILRDRNTDCFWERGNVPIKFYEHIGENSSSFSLAGNKYYYITKKPFS